MTLPSNFLTATETIALVAAGKLTVTQIVEDHLARFDERDGVVHAWVYMSREYVLAEAARLDALPVAKRGPLHGVVVGFKDVLSVLTDTKDLPTEYYSPIYKDSIPGVDSAAVAVLRAAGALIYGKTYTTMFAAIHESTPATNPYNTDYSPGGSSSGSGAAVADWQCHVALGTQTRGSTLRPGSYNGVFALKPTWGAISREGVKFCSNTLDTVGFFTRSVADLQLLCNVFHITDDFPPVPRPLSACRFAYVKTDQWEKGSGASPALRAAWDKSKTLLQNEGANVVEISLPKEFNDVHEISHVRIMNGESRVSFLAEYLMAPELLTKELRGHVENTANITRKQLLQAYDTMASLRPVIDRLAGEYDAIIAPSTPDTAPFGLASTGDPRFQSIWTALHVPVMNVPGFAGDNGMPIGLTLVAPRYEDQRLVAVGTEVAKAWVNADADRLNSIPAPEGAKRLVV